MAIQPIETSYAGCRFRSRLEARWAVFFDHLDIPWRYEPQGYIVDGQPYLCDFLLYPNSDLSMWFEVKGRFPNKEELAKAQGLATATGTTVYLYFGELAVPHPELMASPMRRVDYHAAPNQWRWDDQNGWFLWWGDARQWQINHRVKPTAYRFNPATERFPAVPPRSGIIWWTECRYCRAVVLKLDGQSGFCPTLSDDFRGDLYPSFDHATPRLTAAYTAARSARFEHGA